MVARRYAQTMLFTLFERDGLLFLHLSSRRPALAYPPPAMGNGLSERRYAMIARTSSSDMFL